MTRDDNRLAAIQALQFTDRSGAQALLLDLVREIFPDLKVASVEVRPLAVSLNSINGFLRTEDGSQLFFKTHVEPNSVITEYYNSRLLAEAGYPVNRPVYSSTEYGKQFLIYEVVTSDSVFDVAREIERGTNDRSDLLAEAQHRADNRLWEIYRSTAQLQSAEESSGAAVHQLFHHRLAGQRYRDFYLDKPFGLPGSVLSWDELTSRRWVVNGIAYEGTLAGALDDAASALRPDQGGWSVVGHGDAHNGNVFLTPEGLMYFDPAFGGRHHPLLDLTKPLAHNVFLARWMYHPQEVAAELSLTWTDDGTTIRVDHDHQPSAIRRMFWQSKVERVLRPLVAKLDLPDWRRTLKASMMCCPLLTMNLSDRDRYSPEVALLGLSYVIEMGLTSDSNHRSEIDRTFEEIS